VQEVINRLRSQNCAGSRRPSALRDETTEKDQNHEWPKQNWSRPRLSLTPYGRAHGHEWAIGGSRDVAINWATEPLNQRRVAPSLKTAEDNMCCMRTSAKRPELATLDQNRILDVSLAEEPRVPAFRTVSFSFGIIGWLWRYMQYGAGICQDYLDPSSARPDDVIAYLGHPF